ncbi:hypothetical protein FSARC_5621 [Fusarium sarcochroum]|uniref:GST N-terminal domain-containing protein n=1 Tax=Fusarium sarcochroum TaxID=1208366 RepID=A0A8H4TZD9_9HYPO|nr:hypothetical protein FSARC_5621 [Fusarium sarcochroum]
MSTKYLHILYLWIEGYFPKRVAFYLLSKNLCSSVEQLYRGETNDPQLRIVRVDFVPGQGFVSQDPENPLPDGKSLPALRLDDASGTSRWISETYSMITYFEDLYPGNDSTNLRQMQAKEAADRAIAQDIIGILTTADNDGGVWLSNCAPIAADFKNIPERERNLAVGHRGKRSMEDNLKAAQTIASGNLEATGWLTPRADGGPGIADVIYAANVRYMQLSWCEFIIEREDLGQLRSWYEKFQTLPFWHEMEETGRFPKEVQWGPGSVLKYYRETGVEIWDGEISG